VDFIISNKEIIRLGAEAISSKSGILKAGKPIKKMEKLVRALEGVLLGTHP